MPAHDDSVLRRVRALLARARHPGATTSIELQNEAQACLRAAQDLMAKHGLSETTIEVSGEADAREVKVDPASFVEEEGFRRKTRTRWDEGLAYGAARACGCGVYYFGVEVGPGSWMRNVIFYGLPQDVAVARELFAYLRDALSGAVKRYLQERRATEPWITAAGIEARSFRDGFIRAVRDAATEGIRRLSQSHQPIQAQRREPGQATSTALTVATGELVRAREAALDVYQGRLGLRSRTSGRVFRDLSAYAAGTAAGARVSLDRHTLR